MLVFVRGLVVYSFGFVLRSTSRSRQPLGGTRPQTGLATGSPRNTTWPRHIFDHGLLLREEPLRGDFALSSHVPKMRFTALRRAGQIGYEGSVGRAALWGQRREGSARHPHDLCISSPSAWTLYWSMSHSNGWMCTSVNFTGVYLNIGTFTLCVCVCICVTQALDVNLRSTVFSLQLLKTL